jgi:hypothetical protein
MKQGYSREVNHTIRLFHHGEAKLDGTADKLRRWSASHPAQGHTRRRGHPEAIRHDLLKILHSIINRRTRAWGMRPMFGSPPLSFSPDCGNVPL